MNSSSVPNSPDTQHALLRQLESQLNHCLRRDQYRFRRSIDRLRGDLKNNKVLSGLEELISRVEQSRQSRQVRADSVPKFEYPYDLPVAERKDEILEAVLKNQVVIVCGETGSGKTTQLPKICLEAGRGLSGYIGHTQPRRIAARSVANRIAEELKQPMGQAVGFKVRFQDHTSPHSLIKLMTDGILLAETQQDRFLDQYDTLIVDEAHERSLNIDFLLGYLKWLLPRRPDFKLIVTSATIDPQRFSRHFGGAPVIEVSGRTYPVEIRYRPPQLAEEEDETDQEEQRAILTAVDELFRDGSGDILIFLSGEREIRETAETLRKHHPNGCEILPLYSRLSNAEQEKIFKLHGKRRIVLATNVAETSLTVPGIRAVIDTGHARISRYSHRSKLQRLPIEKVSQASANQRAGRCGRIGPGVCIRLYSQEDFQRRPEFTDPEILRTNLAAVMLQMKALGLGELGDFPFIEPPDERMVRDGVKTLQELNAIDDSRRLTEIGKRLAKLPVDPKLGRILVAGSDENSLTEVAVIVSALSLQDPRERPPDRQQAADQKHARLKDENSDFLALVKLWDEYQEQKKHLSNSKLRKWCQENFLSYVRMREWEDIHAQIMQVGKGELKLSYNQQPADYGNIHRALLTGLLSNVGFRQEGSEYLGARGTKFQIFPGSFLFKSRPKWILCSEQVETSKVYGRMVAKIEPEWVERCGAHLLKRHYYDPCWEKKAARGAILERVMLFSLTILNGRPVPYENIDPKAAREMFIRSALVEMNYDSKAPFFAHNRQLLADADYLQQKGRRVDLVVDEEWMFRFYDERLPIEVVNGVTFEGWRKTAERSNPKVLWMSREDITRKEDESVHDRNFPDELVVGDLRIALEYRFEPGHEDDGVTAIIPIHLLNQLKPEPFQWLVPGLLRDKLVALIKNLPKPTRRHFVPVPDFADRALPQLDFGKGKLTQQLSAALRRLSGFGPSESEWSEEGIPVHLRMNFALVNESKVVVARARDLDGLKKAHSAAAVSNFKELAKDELSMTGCREWKFGDLAERHQSGSLLGFPALVDEGETVGLRLFDTAESAAASQERGLIRLFSLAMSKEMKYLKKNLPVGAAEELVYRKLMAFRIPLMPQAAGGARGSMPPAQKSAKPEPVRDLRDDAVDRVMAALFLDDQPDVRTAAAFEQRLSQRRGEVVPVGNTVGKLIGDVLKLYVEASKKLSNLRPGPSVQDMQLQLDALVFAGFVASTPFVRLREYPRYLKALLYRIDKTMQDSARDQRQLTEVLPHWQIFWEWVEKGKSAQSPERDGYRWMLEELRVSVFAQILKTPLPVSGKRLQEAWAKRVKV